MKGFYSIRTRRQSRSFTSKALVYQKLCFIFQRLLYTQCTCECMRNKVTAAQPLINIQNNETIEKKRRSQLDQHDDLLWLHWWRRHWCEWNEQLCVCLHFCALFWITSPIMSVTKTVFKECDRAAFCLFRVDFLMSLLSLSKIFALLCVFNFVISMMAEALPASERRIQIDSTAEHGKGWTFLAGNCFQTTPGNYEFDIWFKRFK